MQQLLLEPYLLGCLLGDGGLHGNLTFASKDSDIVEQVNASLSLYGYALVKRSAASERDSEYSIKPNQKHTIKYLFMYKGQDYTSSQLLEVLQHEGYPISNCDTLKNLAGCGKAKYGSYLVKYFPELKDKITYKQLRNDQTSIFLKYLDHYNLRVPFDKKRIPADYLCADLDHRLALFQGLMDTDGSYSSNKRLEFCVSNEQLANDFAVLAASLGYTYKIYTRVPTYFNKKYNEVRTGHTAYRVLLNYNEAIIPFRCKRKLVSYSKKCS